MRWLYIPNENTEGDQVGPRMAFEKLYANGVLTAYKSYSYHVRAKVATCHNDALNELLETALLFSPDVIFIQHTTNVYPMNRTFLEKLKNIPSKPKLVLYEEDVYGYLTKRMDATIRAVLSESDICFMGGAGHIAAMALKAGAKKVRLALHSYDSRRFGTPWQPTLIRKYDAVMIGNLTCLKRIPWLHMPGGRKRKLTARALYSHLGDRFGVYGAGQGWDGEPYCKGSVAFDKQGDVIRDSWMSVNWGIFDEIPMYSSDRLSISLACGVPHVANYQPGYEYVFDRIPGLFTVKSPKEALDVALYILSLSVDRRNELGLQAAEYARKHLEATVVYADIVTVVHESLFGLTETQSVDVVK